jgi:hypothetical protein
MHRLNGCAAPALACFLPLFAVSQVDATTIATFADPARDSPATPVFTVDTTAGTLVGLWKSPGLTLETNAGTFFNVLFAMPQISFDGSFNTGAGFAEFRLPTQELLLRIDFDSGHLNNPLSFGATQFLGLNVVSFSGPVVADPGVVPGTESFTFGFANQTATPSGYTATAAFTSSGQLVPEPASAAGIGLVMLAAARRRRR